MSEAEIEAWVQKTLAEAPPISAATRARLARLLTPSITCPRCGLTSYHPDDVRQGYCGNCHDWTTRSSPDGGTFGS